jgi:hypothetical protein
LIATTSDGKNLRATNNVGNVEYGATETFQGYVQTMKNQKEHNIMNSRGGKAQDYKQRQFITVQQMNLRGSLHLADKNPLKQFNSSINNLQITGSSKRDEQNTNKSSLS